MGAIYDPAESMKTIKRLATLNVIGTYGLILFGGYVASSGTGMGCGPDWPLCNGDVLPTLQGATFVEFTHRVIGGLIALLTISVTICARRRLPPHSKGRRISAWMLAMLGVQILLGAITVWFHLPPAVTTLHLLLALTFLAAGWWLWRVIEQEIERNQMPVGKSSAVRRVVPALVSRRFVGLTAGVTYLTLGLGAWVKHTGVGATCGWFSCGPGILPLNAFQWLQSAHRISGLTLAALVLVIVYRAWKDHWPKVLQARVVLLGGFVLLQASIGIVTVVSALALPVSLAHLAIGTAFAIVLWDLWLAAGKFVEGAQVIPSLLQRAEAEELTS